MFNLGAIKAIYMVTNSLRYKSVMAKSLKYSKYGEPSKVIEIVEDELQQPQDNQVLVKVLAAPINPVDINTIQGKYPVKPKFPAIGGNECVAKVLSVGKNVTKLTAGQHVVPFTNRLGTWTTHAIFSEEELMPVPPNIGLAEAATISINPCTAYRMLKDFVKLNEGDWVIQNGANSAVGQAVHQLCHAWNVRSLGIVRDRQDIGQLKEYLRINGATEVLTEEEISTTKICRANTPRLALNCIGGKSATELMRHLDDKAVMVTYGNMSRKPFFINTEALMCKSLTLLGFWMDRWIKENYDTPQRKQMFDDICRLIGKGELFAPIYEMVPMQEYKDAMTLTMDVKAFTGRKYILDMQE